MELTVDRCGRAVVDRRTGARHTADEGPARAAALNPLALAIEPAGGAVHDRSTGGLIAAVAVVQGADVEVETCRIEEDSPALGKSFEEMAIRPRTGASVIALMRAGVTQSNPSPKTVLESGDIIALLGPRDTIRRAMSYLVDVKDE